MLDILFGGVLVLFGVIVGATIHSSVYLPSDRTNYSNFYEALHAGRLMHLVPAQKPGELQRENVQ